MDQKIVDRLFSPFVTTKPSGCGTWSRDQSFYCGSPQGHATLQATERRGRLFHAPVTSRTRWRVTKDAQALVIVVDDDEAVRSSTRLLLKSVGLPAVTYSSAQEFLDNYDPQQPGCVVLDVRMPGMSGLELQQFLNLRGAVIPVIFITGHGDIPMAVEAMQQGAFDFLQKPFRDQDLLDRVQRALEKDRGNRAQLREKNRIQERRDSLDAARARDSGSDDSRQAQQGDGSGSRA